MKLHKILDKVCVPINVIFHCVSFSCLFIMSTIIFFATFVIDKNGLAMIDNNTVLITMIVLVGICLLILICGFFLHLRYQSLTQISLLSYIPAWLLLLVCLVLIFIKSLYIFGEINLFFSLVQNSDVDSGRIDSDSFQFSPSAVILLVISAVTILFCLGKFSWDIYNQYRYNRECPFSTTNKIIHEDSHVHKVVTNHDNEVKKVVSSYHTRHK